MRKLALLITFALCGAGILLGTSMLQRAAAVMDAGLRPLAVTGYKSPPGPVYLENDSYYWLSMAERMESEGVLRVRETHADNAPYGRPVYWSQSIAWLIRALAEWPSFRSLPGKCALASVWVNPLLAVIFLGLAMAILAPVSVRLACFFAVLFASLGDVTWAFSSLRPDHQSLQAGFLIVIVCLLFRVGFGYGRPRLEGDVANARKPGNLTFAAAGIVLGLSLWVSAAAFMPFLVVLTTFVCVFAFWQGAPDDSRAASRGWMVFGACAAATSLLFWVVEYVPDWRVLRLEVNSPFFSVWVLLLSAGMAVAMNLRPPGQGIRWPLLLLLFAIGGLCLALPGAILFGPASWYLPRDPYMDRLHNFITEFYTYWNFTKGKPFANFFANYQAVLPLAALAVPAAFLSKHRPARAASILVLVLVAALTAMSFRQIRWFALSAPLLCFAAALGAVLVPALFAGRWRQGLQILLGLVVAGQACAFGFGQFRSVQPVIAGKAILNELVQPILNKRVALALAASPHKPSAVMCDPSLVPALHYFAGIPSVVSFYWENTAGARDAALFFADEKGDTAREIATRRGLSHVILPPGYLLPNYFYYIAHGHFDRPAANATLAGSLGDNGPLRRPDWLETDDELTSLANTPMSYRGQIIDQNLRIYRIKPEEALGVTP